MIRALRLLLFACPPAFRREYGEEILALSARRFARVRKSRPKTVALWCRTAADLILTAITEWSAALSDSVGFDVVRDHQPRRVSMFDRLSLDLRQAVRRLASTPVFTGAVILVLSAGIGATTAIFSAVDTFAIRELPFARPQELVYIYQDSDSGRPESNSYPAFLDISEHRELFAAAGAVMPEATATWLAPSGDTEVVHVEFAASTYFPALGLRPVLGRYFATNEDHPGAPAVALISHSAWRRRYAGDPRILGRTVRLNGAAVTIVGVGPQDYNGFMPGLVSDFWLSISSMGPVGGAFRERTLKRREDHWFQVVARLAPGRTAGEAQVAMNALADRLGREFPETDRGRRITVMKATDVRVHPELDEIIYPTAGLHLLLGALVMAVVCANLSNLTLARAAARRRELAIRLAIGATRAQLARSLVLESILLALSGGALGLLLAWWLVGLLRAWEIPLDAPMTTAVAVDYRVVLFALVLSASSGVAFGLLPAIWNSRHDLTRSLKAETGPVRRLFRFADFRGFLVVVQIAVSLALIACGGILIRSMMHVLRIDLGFDPDSVASMTLDASHGGRPPAQAAALLMTVRDRVASLPAVDGAALATRPPFSGRGATNTLVIDERAVHPTPTGTVEVAATAVTADYFRVLSLPIIHGRPFDERDTRASGPVAIVSESMARRFWNTTDVVGRRYQHEGSTIWITIVGVARDAPIDVPGEPPRAFIYRPFAQNAFGRAGLLIRARGDASGLLNAAREEIRTADSAIAILKAATMREHAARTMAIPRAASRLLASLGSLAVLLAAVGVYGIVAVSVARRRGEMGIRMALGATSSDVVRMVLREIVVLLTAGVGAGVLLGSFLTPALQNLLVGIQPLDPVTFGAVAALVSMIAFVTAWIPARRAADANPASVLRAE